MQERMKMGKYKIWTVIIFALAIFISSCTSTKRGCDGIKKRKVDMGYM